MAITTQQTGWFSGYTLSQLRSLVLRKLRVTDTSRYSSTAETADYDWIDDALNRGQEAFVRETLCLRTYAIVEMKANYRTYRLPEDFLDLMSAYFYDTDLSDGFVELTAKSVEELNDEVSDWRTETGRPKYIYVDRQYGANWMFGLYPIPDTAGSTITFDSDYGTVVQWVCPNYTYSAEYGTVLRMTDTDEYLLNTDDGVVARVESLDHNVWIDYYRLPKLLEYSTQYPEIPREYQKALPEFAAADLLQNNPEDSVEFKRSALYDKRFNDEVTVCKKKRKRPIAARNLQARSHVWSWLGNMDWHSGMP